MKPLYIILAALGIWYVPTLIAVMNLEISIATFNILKIEAETIEAAFGLRMKNKSGTRLGINSINTGLFLNGLEIGHINQKTQ